MFNVKPKKQNTRTTIADIPVVFLSFDEPDADLHWDLLQQVTPHKRIARVHGIFVGPSSGAHLIAAKRLKAQYGVENVVTFFCDEGEKYINDYWIKK